MPPLQVVQARWKGESALLTLPHVESGTLRLFAPLDSLPRLVEAAHGGQGRAQLSALSQRLAKQMEYSDVQEVRAARLWDHRGRVGAAATLWPVHTRAPHM